MQLEMIKHNQNVELKLMRIISQGSNLYSTLSLTIIFGCLATELEYKLEHCTIAQASENGAVAIGSVVTIVYDDEEEEFYDKELLEEVCKDFYNNLSGNLIVFATIGIILFIPSKFLL